MKTKPNHMMPVVCQRDRKNDRWTVHSRAGVLIAELYGGKERSLLELGQGEFHITGKRRNLLRQLERFLGGKVKWEDVDDE